MTGPGLRAAAQLVEQLDGLDELATTDPKQAGTNRPCALVAPPVLDWTTGTYDGPAVEHRVLLLSSHASFTLEAWRQLDDMLDQLAQLVDVERASPGDFPLAEGNTAPCYVVTVTT